MKLQIVVLSHIINKRSILYFVKRCMYFEMTEDFSGISKTSTVRQTTEPSSRFNPLTPGYRGPLPLETPGIFWRLLEFILSQGKHS